MSSNDETLRITPLPERGKFESLKLKEDLQRVWADEVSRWRIACPEIFKSQEYMDHIAWCNARLHRAAVTIGKQTEAKYILISGVDPAAAWSYIVQQDGWPLHKKPPEWALAQALSLDQGFSELGGGGDAFAVEDRRINALEHQLIAELLITVEQEETR